jgi:hypothetical protein
VRRPPLVHSCWHLLRASSTVTRRLFAKLGGSAEVSGHTAFKALSWVDLSPVGPDRLHGLKPNLKCNLVQYLSAFSPQLSRWFWLGRHPHSGSSRFGRDWPYEREKRTDVTKHGNFHNVGGRSGVVLWLLYTTTYQKGSISPSKAPRGILSTRASAYHSWSLATIHKLSWHRILERLVLRDTSKGFFFAG